MVYQKIHEIMKENSLIQKDGKIEMGSKGSYTVLTERKVLEVLRPAFIEKKLVIVPHRIEHFSRTGSVTNLGMSWTIVDIEDNHEILVASVGQGSSTGDKGAGSAFTYCLKYLLMKLTQMMSGDDPDQVGDNVHDEEKEKNTELAVKLSQEVTALISGKKITQEIGKGMIEYLQANQNDPAILRDAENQINQMKSRMA